MVNVEEVLEQRVNALRRRRSEQPGAFQERESVVVAGAPHHGVYLRFAGRRQDAQCVKKAGAGGARAPILMAMEVAAVADTRQFHLSATLCVGARRLLPTPTSPRAT